MTDIQYKIDQAADNHAKGIYFEGVNRSSCKEDFTYGANYVLKRPELMKEAIVDMLEWITSEKSPYAIIYGGKKRFCTNDKDLTIEDVFDKYIEHLKQK